MPLYAVVDKSKKGQAESKPVTRNVSELYAKVSKPKKSAGNQVDSSLSNSGPENRDQSAYPCLEDDMMVRTGSAASPVFQYKSDEQCTLPASGSNKPMESGYNSIDFGTSSSPDPSSNYDNLNAGERTSSKEPMYEDMATVLSKVDQSNSGLH